MLYLSAVCMLRISRKFVAIQMKSIMLIGTFISYDFMLARLYATLYFPFNSRLGVHPTSHLNSSGYEVGFRCVKWCVEFVQRRSQGIAARVCQKALGSRLEFSSWWYRICLVLVATPSYFLYFAKAFIYSRRSKTRKSTGTSCRIEIIFRFNYWISHEIYLTLFPNF